MRRTLATMTLVATLLVFVIFSYRALHPSVPKRMAIVRTVAEGQTIALSGMDYLSQLRREGHLPGVATNEHGNATFIGRLASYPYSLTIHLTIGGETFTNNYIIVQTNKDSQWQLKRAWQTDSKGQIIQEWTVK